MKGKEKVTKDGKGKGKEKGQGNGKGKCIAKHTPGGDDISRTVALQLLKDMSTADLDTEGLLGQVYSDPEASLAVSISSDDDANSTESHSEYDSELLVDMCMEDDVDALDGVDIDGDVDIERVGEDEEDEEEEDEKEEQVLEEDEEEDEDNGKEHCTIVQGEMTNKLAYDPDSMVGDEPTMLPEQGQEMREQTL
jgi:hypothetical protein